jgi:hypothetical protein
MRAPTRGESFPFTFPSSNSSSSSSSTAFYPTLSALFFFFALFLSFYQLPLSRETHPRLLTFLFSFVYISCGRWAAGQAAQLCSVLVRPIYIQLPVRYIYIYTQARVWGATYDIYASARRNWYMIRGVWVTYSAVKRLPRGLDVDKRSLFIMYNRHRFAAWCFSVWSFAARARLANHGPTKIIPKFYYRFCPNIFYDTFSILVHFFSTL